MTKNELLQQKKNEALNKIRAIYNPLIKNQYGHHNEGSYREKESEWIELIIQNLEKELLQINKQFKNNL